jgi:hypothetical protein
MWKLFVANVTKPIARRIGSVASGWLLSVGVSQDVTTTIVTGLTAGILVGADLVVEKWVL